MPPPPSPPPPVAPLPPGGRLAPVVRTRLTVAGTVEAFGPARKAALKTRLLLLFPSAIDARLTVSAASVNIDVEIIYATTSAAQTDSLTLTAMSTATLSTALNESVENVTAPSIALRGVVVESPPATPSPVSPPVEPPPPPTSPPSSPSPTKPPWGPAMVHDTSRASTVLGIALGVGIPLVCLACIVAIVALSRSNKKAPGKIGNTTTYKAVSFSSATDTASASADAAPSMQALDDTDPAVTAPRTADEISVETVEKADETLLSEIQVTVTSTSPTVGRVRKEKSRPIMLLNPEIVELDDVPHEVVATVRSASSGNVIQLVGDVVEDGDVESKIKPDVTVSGGTSKSLVVDVGATVKSSSRAKPIELAGPSGNMPDDGGQEETTRV